MFKNLHYYLLTIASIGILVATVLSFYNPKVKYISGSDIAIFTAYDGTTIVVSGDVASIDSIINNSPFNFTNDPFKIVCDSENNVQPNTIKLKRWNYEGNFKKGRCVLSSSGPVVLGFFTHYKDSPVRILYYHTLVGSIAAALPLLLVIFGIYLYLVACISASREST